VPRSVAFVFYLVAFVCFMLAAFAKPGGRVNLIGLGLALWVVPQAWNAAPWT
jgi:hypothetical protein